MSDLSAPHRHASLTTATDRFNAMVLMQATFNIQVDFDTRPPRDPGLYEKDICNPPPSLDAAPRTARVYPIYINPRARTSAPFLRPQVRKAEIMYKKSFRFSIARDRMFDRSPLHRCHLVMPRSLKHFLLPFFSRFFIL